MLDSIMDLGMNANESLHRVHASNDDIMATLMEDHGLTEEEAQSYLT